MAYRLGVDVGGTFTDLLLINEDMDETFRVKVPTTPANQAAAVLDGLERVCAVAGIEPSALTELMHGTTVTTMPLLEGKGARVGLITTEGYRQILQVARSYVPGGVLRDGSSGPSPSRSRRSMTRWKYASGSGRAAKSCANWMRRARARR
jgi:N-methylhydantoinase A